MRRAGGVIILIIHKKNKSEMCALMFQTTIQLWKVATKIPYRRIVLRISHRSEILVTYICLFLFLFLSFFFTSPSRLWIQRRAKSRTSVSCSPRLPWRWIVFIRKTMIWLDIVCSIAQYRSLLPTPTRCIIYNNKTERAITLFDMSLKNVRLSISLFASRSEFDCTLIY